MSKPKKQKNGKSKSKSKSGIATLFFPTNPLIIDQPAELSSGLAELSVSPGCTVNVHGRVDIVAHPALSRRLRQILARVDSGPEVPGTVSGDNWAVDNVPGVYWSSAGITHRVHIRGLFHDDLSLEITNNRDFISRSGDPACEYSRGAVATAMHRCLPIEEVMPRYFRMAGEFSNEHVFGAMTVHLLAMKAVFLAYDPVVSTPECPVWRDMGLPPGVGGILLRVIRTGSRHYEARLSFQMIGENSVMPAVEVVSRTWSFAKRNRFHGSVACEACKSDVSLLVEPS